MRPRRVRWMVGMHDVRCGADSRSYAEWVWARRRVLPLTGDELVQRAEEVTTPPVGVRVLKAIGDGAPGSGRPVTTWRDGRGDVTPVVRHSDRREASAIGGDQRSDEVDSPPLAVAISTRVPVLVDTTPADAEVVELGCAVILVEPLAQPDQGECVARIENVRGTGTTRVDGVAVGRLSTG